MRILDRGEVLCAVGVITKCECVSGREHRAVREVPCEDLLVVAACAFICLDKSLEMVIHVVISVSVSVEIGLT